LELLDRTGCSDALLTAGYKVTDVSIVAGGEQIAHISVSGVITPHPYALMLPQSETERILDEHLNTYGVEVERSVELTQFSESGDAVVATLRHSDGREETVNSSWLIGCDGAHSTVRHHLAMEFLGDTMVSDWILADVHLSGVEKPGEIKLAWHSDGILAIFPISLDRFRMIADVGDGHGDKLRADPTLEEVQSVLDRRGPGGIKASNPIWLASFRINERKVANYRSGRVFVAGDAAHIHSPAGGQGMNTGIQDACNLAWKLALVRHGQCASEPLLESYSIERSAVGEQVLKAAGRLTTIGIMRGEIKQSLRNHIASLVFGLPAARQALANTLTEVSIGYSESPLSAKGKHQPEGPGPGQRAPIRDNESPVGAGKMPRFALCAESSEAALRLISQYPGLLEPNIREPFNAGGLWLVRPDGYIALAARRDAWDDVSEFLQRLA
jgi:2-polyprenyl-6-methoxyphenol hydroxylase-like FAD-dependent oxidoreductase